MPPGAKPKYDQKYLKNGVKVMGLGQWGKKLKLFYDVERSRKSKPWILWTTFHCLQIIIVLQSGVIC